MKDGYGRVIDYVRISVTDRCNLRCVYCMPEEGVKVLPHEAILTYDEIERICRAMAKLGVKKIKLTGGEPLVRKDLPELVRAIKALPGIEKVTITTNGVLLAERMDDLAAAGIDAVNISMDTTDPELFAQVTRVGRIDAVMDGLKAALSYPEIPVKINCVPVTSEKENFVNMARLAKDYPVHVRFIEIMPIGYGKQFEFHNEDSIRAVLESEFGAFTPCHEILGNGPSHYYSVEGFRGKIGFISSISHKFCEQCNRVRLTAEGFLKTCLQYETGNDLRAVLRNGCTDEELEEVISRTIAGKPISHNFNEEKIAPEECRSMSQIGG
ncbi:MAG: GTP 3',8-cyclase MoaA [Lachnospiraceae bacterium]|nr:GTP 3',8-cyclase MoaA [Lachnospiraceae bacterium]